MSINKYENGTLTRLDGQTLVDANPTQNSTRPVSSGGVYTALAGKVDKGDEITVVGDNVKTVSQVLVDLMGQITSLSALKGTTYIAMDEKLLFRFSYRTEAGKCYFSTCNVLDDTNFEGSTILLDFSTNPISASYKDYDSSTGNITTFNPVIGPQTSFTLHF